MPPISGLAVAPPSITGAPVGHGIGMIAALLMPVHGRRPVHLIDVWEPGRVLQAMLEEGCSAGQGSTFFLISLLDHPDFDPVRHVALMPVIGLGGSAVPAAVGERAERGAAVGEVVLRMDLDEGQRRGGLEQRRVVRSAQADAGVHGSCGRPATPLSRPSSPCPGPRPRSGP